MILKRISGFLEKWDEWLIAGMLIPFAKGLFEKFSSKAGEKVENELEKLLGIKVDEHGKGFGDEILTREAIRVMTGEGEQEAIESFRIWMREKDPNKADAFTLGIAKAVKAFERQKKKLIKSGGKNKQGKLVGPQTTEETTGVEYDHSWSTNFLQRLISYETNEAKEEFVFEGENFKSLIQPEKGPSPVIKAVKTVYEKVKPVVISTTESIREHQTANLADLRSGLEKDLAEYEQSKLRRAERKRRT